MDGGDEDNPPLFLLLYFPATPFVCIDQIKALVASEICRVVIKTSISVNTSTRRVAGN